MKKIIYVLFLGMTHGVCGLDLNPLDIKIVQSKKAEIKEVEANGGCVYFGDQSSGQSFGEPVNFSSEKSMEELFSKRRFIKNLLRHLEDSVRIDQEKEKLKKIDQMIASNKLQRKKERILLKIKYADSSDEYFELLKEQELAKAKAREARVFRPRVRLPLERTQSITTVSSEADDSALKHLLESIKSLPLVNSPLIAQDNKEGDIESDNK